MRFEMFQNFSRRPSSLSIQKGVKVDTFILLSDSHFELLFSCSWLSKRKFPKMMSLINRILDWFKSLFWKEEMELTLVGLQYSGKTTFVNVIAVCY